MNFDKMTVKELREYAKDNDINLEGRDKKADIIATIVGGDIDLPEGAKHEMAANADRDACLKAMAG